MFRLVVVVLVLITISYGIDIQENLGQACTSCKDFNSNLKSMLGSNKARKTLHFVSYGWCALVTTGPQEAAECANELIPAVNNLQQNIQEFFNPEVPCSTYNFCEADKSPLLQNCKQNLDDKNSPHQYCTQNLDDKDVICEYCIHFTSSLKKFANAEPRYEMKLLYVKNTCDAIATPELKQACVKGAVGFIDSWRHITEKHFHPESVCRATGFCKATNNIQKVDDSSEEICEDCTDFCAGYKEIIASKHFRSLFMMLFNKHCQYISSASNLEACTSLRMQVFDFYLEWIAKFYDPTSTCLSFGFCKPKV